MGERTAPLMNKLPRFVLAIVGILLIVLALARALHSWSNHSHVFDSPQNVSLRSARKNEGAPGVDGLTVAELKPWLKGKRSTKPTCSGNAVGAEVEV